MNLVSRTIYSSYIQTILLTGTKFKLAANSTLNELYGIQNGISPLVTPTLGYFAIGNGGHKITVGANGIPLMNPIQHQATDAALYHGLPFILRPINNDIDTVTQANYALRRIETHGGNQYIAYYLKRLGISTVIPDMENIVTANGISTATTFIPNSSNLNPTPPVLSNTGVNLVSGDYVAASAKLNIALTASEVTELLNVSTILYGDPSYAIISEIALCSGVDKVVQSASNNNSTISFNEALAVQVLSFVNSFFAMQFSSAGISLLLDVGASEPILSLV